MKVKAVVGSVFPSEPGATFHCRPILEGYARVMVDEITEGFEDLQLDHPTSEGETRLGSALKTPCLCTTRKRAIDGIDTNGAPDKRCAISIY